MNHDDHVQRSEHLQPIASHMLAEATGGALINIIFGGGRRQLGRIAPAVFKNTEYFSGTHFWEYTHDWDTGSVLSKVLKEYPKR